MNTSRYSRRGRHPPVLMGVACSNSRGRPGPNSEVLPPREITDFHFLYAKNCAACHGPEGKDGAAILARQIPCSSRLPMTRSFAASPQPAYRALRCRPSRPVRGECSPTNRSTQSLPESAPGRSPVT